MFVYLSWVHLFSPCLGQNLELFVDMTADLHSYNEMQQGLSPEFPSGVFSTSDQNKQEWSPCVIHFAPGLEPHSWNQ